MTVVEATGVGSQLFSNYCWGEETKPGMAEVTIKVFYHARSTKSRAGTWVLFTSEVAVLMIFQPLSLPESFMERITYIKEKSDIFLIKFIYLFFTFSVNLKEDIKKFQ